MEAASFIAVALACAPQVHLTTAQALVSVESAFNPWAVGVVGGALEHQPRNLAQALSTAKSLRASGWNFSVGLGQINVHNLPRLGLSLDAAFDPCTNLAAMQQVLMKCFESPIGSPPSPAGDQVALRRALSCYYSGNSVTGYRDGYVRKVVAATAEAARAHPHTPRKEKP